MEEANKIKRVKRSFTDAFHGLVFILKTEINFKIELAVAFTVIVLMLIFKITDIKALILIMVIMTVLLAEIMNTAIERMMDVVHPGRSKNVKNIKDSMAASVLLASIIAVIIGLIVFIPYFRIYV